MQKYATIASHSLMRRAGHKTVIDCPISGSETTGLIHCSDSQIAPFENRNTAQHQWENQDKYNGGWECKDGKLGLKSTSKEKTVVNIFHNPNMPTMDDYYEPWTYDYQHLFNAPEGPDQPTARPISMVTGELIQIQAGPNWDDDLGGSPVYAQNDPNLKGLTPEQQQQLFAVERLVFFYFPRICNHCLNAACVAACPSGALYKRGEDGIVLVDQNRCRGWRACVAACPYKKVFYNWNTGKSEKCILCFPRLETGQAPACFHSCVGRIRYLGNVLYDASRIEEVAKLPDDQLVEGQRSLILDPHDPEVIAPRRGQTVRSKGWRRRSTRLGRPGPLGRSGAWRIRCGSPSSPALDCRVPGFCLSRRP
jgi:nitrate reductase beta subunit